MTIFRNFAEEFEVWDARTAGLRGDKYSAGIMAVMALHRIDPALSFALMSPELTADTAATMIMKRLEDVIYRRTIEALTPEQRVQFLQDVRQSQQKVDGKK